MASPRPIPVIDLFAGPGGLGEGFASLGRPEGKPRFAIRLSIEKDPIAHATLELRAFLRQFNHGDAPTDYYDHLRGELTRDELFQKWARQADAARHEAWHAELGIVDPAQLRERISSSLSPRLCGGRAFSLSLPPALRGEGRVGGSSLDPWVLIGGPPCQAYSLVGRSRNKGIAGYQLANDPKARLYLEYLQLIADFWPAVFVMENVKGLLSSQIDGEPVFDKICEDLTDPAKALKRQDRTRRNAEPHTYSLHALTRQALFESPADFVIRSEQYGIPQARHRIIVIGIRDDLDRERLKQLTPSEGPTVEQMIRDLPALRSGLSKEDDSSAAWVAAVLELCRSCRVGGVFGTHLTARNLRIDSAVLEVLKQLPAQAKKMAKLDRGAEYLASSPCIQYERDWFVDERLGGVCNHATRSHIRSDLHRYLFAAAYAEAHHRSPQIADFPSALLPAHDNVADAMEGATFADRFRVQHRYRHATTVTSHISKDGHYYIHYDPKQCRSLTVREAARLQTFPDNYFYTGRRTMQYNHPI